MTAGQIAALAWLGVAVLAVVIIMAKGRQQDPRTLGAAVAAALLWPLVACCLLAIVLIDGRKALRTGRKQS